ncbi:hypothetical protein ACWDD9_15695 [Kitasatospora sp. NPDC001119]
MGTMAELSPALAMHLDRMAIVAHDLPASTRVWIPGAIEPHCTPTARTGR